jgi:hypothetical protein
LFTPGFASAEKALDQALTMLFCGLVPDKSMLHNSDSTFTTETSQQRLIQITGRPKVTIHSIKPFIRRITLKNLTVANSLGEVSFQKL